MLDKAKILLGNERQWKIELHFQWFYAMACLGFQTFILYFIVDIGFFWVWIIHGFTPNSLVVFWVLTILV